MSVLIEPRPFVQAGRVEHARRDDRDPISITVLRHGHEPAVEQDACGELGQQFLRWSEAFAVLR